MRKTNRPDTRRNTRQQKQFRSLRPRPRLEMLEDRRMFDGEGLPVVAFGPPVVVDDGGVPVPSENGPYAVTEGQVAGVTIQLQDENGNPVTSDDPVRVEYTVDSTKSTAEPGADFTPPFDPSRGGEVVIPAGQSSVTILIPTVDDEHVEPIEQFALKLTAVSSGAIEAGADATQVVTILDNDVATLNVSDARPARPGGADAEGEDDRLFRIHEGQEAEFTVTLDRPVLHDVTVYYWTYHEEDGQFSRGNAEANDYSQEFALHGGQIGQVTIPRGATSVTLKPIATVDDPFPEGAEVFYVRVSVDEFSAATSVKVGDGKGDALIVDNDRQAPLVFPAGPGGAWVAPGPEPNDRGHRGEQSGDENSAEFPASEGRPAGGARNDSPSAVDEAIAESQNADGDWDFSNPLAPEVLDDLVPGLGDAGRRR